ncbi:unnamed protein product, partial [Closterium sp. Naga37s-1]
MSARSLRIESTAGSRNGSTRVGVGVGVDSPGGAVEASVQVGTQITVSGVSLDINFDALRCFTFPKAALKALKAGRGVQVWWNGLKGGSKSGSKGAGSTRGKEAGTEGRAAGAACKQVQFFANPACKGKALDEVLKPQYAGLRKFFNVPSTKKISRWTSVSCTPDVTCQHATCPSNSTCMPTSDSKGVTCACNPGFAANNGSCL